MKNCIARLTTLSIRTGIHFVLYINVDILGVDLVVFKIFQVFILIFDRIMAGVFGSILSLIIIAILICCWFESNGGYWAFVWNYRRRRHEEQRRQRDAERRRNVS